MEIFGKSKEVKKEKEKLRQTCLDMLDDNRLVDFQNNNTRNEIEKALNSIKDVEKLRDIADLIGSLTDNLNKLLVAKRSEDRDEAIFIAKRKRKNIKKILGVQLVIVNNIV